MIPFMGEPTVLSVATGLALIGGREDACARHYGIDEAVIADEA